MNNNDNIKQKEHVLILPYNTLRVIDVPILAELNKANSVDEKLDYIIFRCVNRKNKNILSLMPSRTYDDNIHEYLNILGKVSKNINLYYNVAPSTDVYDIVSIMKKQSFVKSVTILFNNSSLSDDEFENDYLDYSYYIPETNIIHKYIIGHNITSLFCSDASLMFELIRDHNEDKYYDSFSFFISRIGYNYKYSTDSQRFLMNDIKYISDNSSCDIEDVSLIKFSSETINHFKQLQNKKGETK